MDRTCSKCGAELEAGAVFCSKCGAPQIRVSTAAREASAESFPPGTPGDIQPPAQPLGITAPAIDWRRALAPAFSGGILAAVLSFVPILSLGVILWALLGGATAVRLYLSRVPAARITPRLGARLGALAGLLAFVLNTALSLWGIMQPGFGTAFRKYVQEDLQGWIARNSDPQTQELGRQIAASLLTPQGLALLIGVGFFAMLLIFVLFGAAGGAFSGWRRERRRQQS